jgi:NADPH:quinone reductase-like Zn-dependent oxidoreductase
VPGIVSAVVLQQQRMHIVVNTPTETMKAIYLTGHGDTDKLVLRTDLPLPEYGPGDVLVNVAAAALNNTDINTRIGWYSKQDGAIKPLVAAEFTLENIVAAQEMFLAKTYTGKIVLKIAD